MAGLSEMLGGAVSMGLAAFISARSQIEFYHSEIEREHLEMRKWPDRERDEIRAIYRAKGLYRKAARRYRRSHHLRSQTLERRHDARGTGASAASSSRRTAPARPSDCPTCAARQCRFLPYLFVAPARGVVYSAVATLVALFVVGAAKTIITTRSWWRSGLESALTGAAAAAATFAAGSLFSRL